MEFGPKAVEISSDSEPLPGEAGKAVVAELALTSLRPTAPTDAIAAATNMPATRFNNPCACNGSSMTLAFDIGPIFEGLELNRSTEVRFLFAPDQLLRELDQLVCLVVKE